MAAAVAPVAEALEARQLLASVELSSGLLKIHGDWNSKNAISVWAKGDTLYGQVGSLKKGFSLSKVKELRLNGGNLADLIWVDRDVTKPSKIWGFGGNDTVWGGDGNNTVLGGDGNDLLAGYGGNDSMRGENGKDTLFGSSGKDTLDGGPGDDMKYDDLDGPWNVKSEPLEPRKMLASIALSNGELSLYGNKDSANTEKVVFWNNAIYAEIGSQKKSFSPSSVSSIKIYGGDKGDKIWVDPKLTKKTTIWGKAGNDTIFGGGGNDTVYGGGGNDLLMGYAGNDKLMGEGGRDTLYGGAGTDSLDGGADTDYKYDDLNDPWSTPPTSGGGTSGGSSGGGSIPTDSSAASPSASITATTSKSINAGQAVHFHALSSSLGKGTPITARYQWDFGDSGSAYNKLEGFNVAHHYEKAGTYTVKLTITNEGGKVDTATTTVNVGSANRKVIYVSASGSDSNSGTSSSSPIKSFSKAVSLVGDNSNIEVLFRRGDTFSLSKGMNISGDNIVVGAYGSGSNPVLKYNGSKSYDGIISPGSSADNVTVKDLTFDTIYSSGTSWSDMPVGVKPSGRNISVIGSNFYNLGYAIQAESSPNGLLVQDNSAPSRTALKGYFAWAAGSDHVYLGNTVANTYSHILRTGAGGTSLGMERLNISYNNFSNPMEGSIRGTLTLHTGQYYYVANNTLTDGKVTFGPLGEDNGMDRKGDRMRWGVFENNVVNSEIIIEHGAERIMLRNNVIKNNSDYAIQVEGYSSSYGRGVKDVWIVNNTGINTASTGNFLNVGSGGVDGIRLVNNLYVAPNMTTGSSGSASVFVKNSNLGDFTWINGNVWAKASASTYAQGGQNYVYDYWSNADGYKDPNEWNAYSVVGTDYFADVSVSSSYAPSSSSVANGAASQYAGVFTDRNGKIRGSGDWTAGAVEV